MELWSACFASFMVFVAVLVQHAANTRFGGAAYVLSTRDTPPNYGPAFGRITRTLQNNLESCAMYAPLAIAVALTHRESVMTWTVAVAYVFARIVFNVSYWFGINGVRSVAWLVGMVSTGVMASAMLTAY
jgi:uncharacterized MAPEG superfamily protein